MNLSQLLDQQKVILDANILIYAWTRASGQCQRMLQRAGRGELECVVPLHILAEASHRMMILEARSKGQAMGGNPARYLAKHPQDVKTLSEYQALTRGILNARVKVEASLVEDLFAAHELQAAHGLLTNDAMLVALAQRLDIHSIASSDQAFQGIPGLTLYGPEDIGA